MPNDAQVLSHLGCYALDACSSADEYADFMDFAWSAYRGDPEFVAANGWQRLWFRFQEDRVTDLEIDCELAARWSA